MKNLKAIIGLALIGAALTATSCQQEESITPQPVTNLRAESTPGRIVLRWDTPKDANIAYVMVTYHDPLLKKDVLKTASVYADSVEIPDTRKKYGEYTFTVQSVSPTDDKSEVQTISKVSEPAIASIAVKERVALPLTIDRVFSDDPEPSEGPLPNLIDGNKNNFFHMRWSGASQPMPHYVVVDLGKEVGGVRMSYTSRNNGSSNHPKHIQILGSNSFDKNTFDESVATLGLDIASGLPTGAKVDYTSADIIFDKPYRYVWYKVDETYGTTNWFAIAELSYEELILEIDDPEAPDAE